MDLKEKINLILFRYLVCKNGHSSYLLTLERNKFYMIHDKGPARGEYVNHIPMLNKKLIVKLSYMFHSINPEP